MTKRMLLNAEQIARLLQLGHQYSVVKQVAPGSWLVDSSRAALEALEAQEREATLENLKKLKSVYYTICLAGINELKSLENLKKLKSVYYCTVCGHEPVDAWDGFDTCDYCRSPGGEP